MIRGADKIRKIRDALTIRLGRYPRADVFPYPFTDYLTILVGEPCCITSFIGDGIGNGMAFTTGDGDTSGDVQWRSQSVDLTISIKLIRQRATLSRQKALQATLDQVFEEEGQEVVRYFAECLAQRKHIGRPFHLTPIDNNEFVFQMHKKLLDGLRDLWRLLEQRYAVNELPPGRQRPAIKDVSIYIRKPGTDELMILDDSRDQPRESVETVAIATAYKTGLIQWLPGCSGITVPFHVHGAPWMVFQYRPSDAEIWQSCYAFYREFTPELGDALRTWVRSTLFDHLVAILRVAIRPESSASEIATGMARHFTVLAQCLPSPEICIPPVDGTDEIALLDCGRGVVFHASIARRNQYHPKHLELFDAASPTEVKGFLEGMVRLIAAEEFQRSWTHASFTSHILGTPIAELRGCLLLCRCDGAERARMILDEMDTYRKALHAAVTGETSFEFVGTVEQLIELTRECFPGLRIRHSGPSQKVVLSSVAYLKLVSAVCLDNVREHGCGEPPTVSLYAKGRELWMELCNAFPLEMEQPVTEKLPDIEYGTTDQLGIQTLHLCSDRWFSCRPNFQITRDTECNLPFFCVMLPLARYEG